MIGVLKLNNISGKNSGAFLTLAANSPNITWSADPGIPTITSPDTLRVTVAPGTAQEEIIDILTHTAGSTTGTCNRNVEATANGQNSGAAHSAVDWTHAPTASAFDEDPDVDIARRGGLIGVATAQSRSSNFPYGQVEVSLGDSIAIAYGSSSLGKLDRWSILMQQENDALGLPGAGVGLRLASAGTIGSNLAVVAGLYGASGVSLAGTLNSTGANDSLTYGTTPFGRAIIFYKIQAGSDGIGVSYLGQGGAIIHTIDGTTQDSGGDSNIGWYDTGTAAPAGTTSLSLTRKTHVSGAGGVAPIILGVRFYGPGLTTSNEFGLSIDNIGAGGVTTAGLLNESTNWQPYLKAISASVRRVHIAIGGDDLIVARTSTTAAMNNSATVTDVNGAFSENDVGRPISGGTIPANSYIGVINSSTSVGISSSPIANVPVSTTGGSLTAQAVTYGQVSIGIIQLNLTTIISRVRNAAPNAEIVVYGEYQPWSNALNEVGNNSIQWWAKVFIPAIKAVAIKNNCTFINMFARFGSVSYIRTTSADAVTNSTKTVTSASAAFKASDLGSIITGTNIPGGAYIGKINSSTSVDLSSSPFENIPMVATGGGTGGTLNIGNDVYGLTVDYLHFGDYTNSLGKVDGQRAQANLIREKLSYASTRQPDLGATIVITPTIASLLSNYWQCPVDGLWEIECIAPGGGGAGGGAPTSTATTQVGGGGGGQGETKKARMQLTAGTSYPIAVPLGGTKGTGGAANGHAGTDGTAGGDCVFTGPTTLTAKGGGPGKGGASNSTATVGGGMYGIAVTNLTQGFPGAGGQATAFGGTPGGAALGSGAPAGAGGGSSSATNGGGAGLSGTYGIATTGGGIATSGSANGANAVDPSGSDYGAGGGGGGGGSGTTGKGGDGANGGTAVIYLRRVG